jgi:hypothetical protein
VIEQGRFPLDAVVTVGTRGYLTFGKLPAMNILVTFFATRRSCFEIRVDQFGAYVLRFVAVDACRGTVGPEQRERSLGMIEAG